MKKKLILKLVRSTTLILFAFMVFTACYDGGTNIVYPATLLNTVWAGDGPRSGDWVTFTFYDDGDLVVSFSIDNSSNEWKYSYNSDKGTGTIITGGWPVAPNGFTISGNTLSITNFGNHNPEANPPIVHTFLRYR